MTPQILALILWAVAGALTMIKKKVTKYDYLFCWLVLLLQLTFQIIRG